MSDASRGAWVNEAVAKLWSEQVSRERSGYILSYLAFDKDGGHGQVIEMLFPKEEGARASMAEMVTRHRTHPLYMGLGYRMRLTRGGRLIHEETQGAQ